MIKFHGLQHPPSPEFPTLFLPFFGNIQRDVRCPKKVGSARSAKHDNDKTYIPGKNEARDLCCKPEPVPRNSGGLGGGLAYKLACRPNMIEICQDHVRKSVEFVSLLLEFATGCRFFWG